jgi:putative ABC transport system permease protein
VTGSTPVDIGLGNLLIAAALVGVTAALSAWQHLGLTKSVAIGAIRASVQLLIVAVVLEWIFAGDRLDIVLATLLLMVLVAGHTASARVAEPARRRRILGVICTLSIFIGSALTLAYVDLLVIPISPWWNARYLIPLFGMIVANAMNGAALAAERLRSEINGRRAEIEALLALGASASQAAETPVRLALTAAMIPAINALMVVGIVSLPGMMTGQILAGVDPTLAVRYQLVVVFMLTAATAITATLLVFGYRKQFFSDADQLRPIDETR